MIIVNGWKPLTIITKHSILDVTAALDPPLGLIYILKDYVKFLSFLKLIFRTNEMWQTAKIEMFQEVLFCFSDSSTNVFKLQQGSIYVKFTPVSSNTRPVLELPHISKEIRSQMETF